MPNKKYLLIGGGILLSLILVFFFFRKGDEQKKRDGAIAPNSDTAPSGGLDNAYNYTDTVAGEREEGIVPRSLGGDGNRQKTKLPSRGDFDNRVRAVISQILEEGENGEWFEQIQEDTQEHWSGVAGLSMDKAIYITARSFIAGHYYY